MKTPMKKLIAALIAIFSLVLVSPAQSLKLTAAQQASLEVIQGSVVRIVTGGVIIFCEEPTDSAKLYGNCGTVYGNVFLTGYWDKNLADGDKIWVKAYSIGRYRTGEETMHAYEWYNERKTDKIRR